MPESSGNRYTAIECFAEGNPFNLAEKIAEFNRIKHGFATQIHYNSDEKLWVAFVYYNAIANDD